MCSLFLYELFVLYFHYIILLTIPLIALGKTYYSACMLSHRRCLVVVCGDQVTTNLIKSPVTFSSLFRRRFAVLGTLSTLPRISDPSVRSLKQQVPTFFAPPTGIMQDYFYMNAGGSLCRSRA